METEYENIMALVEEVRGILEHSEISEKKGGQWKQKAFSRKRKPQNPFSGLKKGGKKLGPGPRGRKLQKKVAWSCSCKGTKKTAGAMSVCHCMGKDGQRKRVVIKGAFKDKYNKQYRKWRKKNAKRYSGGAGSPFKKRA